MNGQRKGFAHWCNYQIHQINREQKENLEEHIVIHALFTKDLGQSRCNTKWPDDKARSY